MDNFMDKLSKRFNAGEMIQANGEAEARESQRMKKQIDEYEKMMQEVRRLNLKTAEMSEQVSQMLASGIEQFEAYANERAQLDLSLRTMEAGGPDKEAIAEQLTGEIEKMKTDLLLQTECLQKIINANEKIADQMNVCNDRISLVQHTIEQNKAADTSNQNEVDEISRMLRMQQNAMTNEVENRITGISLRIDNSEATVKREISDASYRVEASVSELRQYLADRFSADSQTEDDEFAKKTVETLQQLVKSQEESTKQLREMIVNLRLYMDEVQKHIEDYVHKEDVKVYRNVQASFAEQMTNRFRDVGDQLGYLDKGINKNKGTKALLVVTFLTAAASVAIQVAQILGVL